MFDTGYLVRLQSLTNDLEHIFASAIKTSGKARNSPQELQGWAARPCVCTVIKESGSSVAMSPNGMIRTVCSVKLHLYHPRDRSIT